MKTPLLILAALAALTPLVAADTPEAILADYQAKAQPALAKVNATLETATVPLIADLVKAGDTAGAEELKTQLKAKQAGEPVPTPHAKAASLFTLYDAARIKALDPAQKAAVSRIDAVLAGSDGKKLEIVEALGKVRAEIEGGKIADDTLFPTVTKWTFQKTLPGTAYGVFTLNPDGTAEMSSNVGKKPAAWKQSKKPSIITVKFPDDIWTVTFSDTHAEIQSQVWPETRYLKKVP